MAIEGGHLSADNFLLFHPELQLAHKYAADVSASAFGRPLQLQPPDQDRENELWDHLKGDLNAYESLRPSVAVRDLAWLHVAQRLDEMMYIESPHTAEKLLDMPDYRLTRKLLADTLADSLTRCLGMSDASCQCRFDAAMDACEIGDAGCNINPINKRLGVCADILRPL